MLILLFLPLLNFLIISFFGRFFGRLGVVYLTLYNFITLVVYSCFTGYYVLFMNQTFYINLGIWFQVSHLLVYWDFIFDAIAVSMLCMISVISAIVHIYSFSYMKMDPHFVRFISYLSLFTFFMFILVTAHNFIQLFLGWEGVGLCSFLLINFWYTRLQANKAAIKALLMNRVGDIGFLIGVSLIFSCCYTLDFSVLEVLLPVMQEMNFVYYNISVLDLVCFFFYIGVMGKSAQLGLHTWLPAAMEGPTPVSALIHAATMVTAGIFLLIRCSFIFDSSEEMQLVITIVGGCTAFLSACTALFLYDIKKIIAYSTCSQLGYMAVACGLSQYQVGLFHLINHAFFKALIFLAAGAIIHSFSNEQDIRRLSGVATRMPFLWIILLIGNFAIMGIPFFSGFYSKDIIIEISFLTHSFDIGNFNVLYLLIMLATCCTGIYSVRISYYLFFRNLYKGVAKTTLNQPFFLQVVLSLLLVGSIVSGYILAELMSPTYFLFKGGLQNFIAGENEFLPWFIKLLPLFVNMLAIIGGLLYTVGVISTINISILYPTIWGAQVFGLFRHLIFYNFYFNEFYNYCALINFNYYYKSVFLLIDKGFLEILGPEGLFFIYRKVVFSINGLYTVNIYKQIMFIYNCIVVFFFLLLFFI